MFRFPIESDKVSNNPLQFEYVNWKGERNARTVIPQEIYYGENDFHKGNQWLLKAFDVDKQAIRHFAIKDIIKFIDNKEDYYKVEDKI
jgi:Predicted transcriptional regulator